MIHSKFFAYSIAAFLAVLLLASGGVFLFQAYWPQHISVAEVPQKAAVVFKRSDAGRIAILRSETTAQFLHSGTGYEAHPQYWRDLLTQAGWASELISDDQLTTDLSPYSALVLPSAICLSDKQQNAIRAFLEQGHGVVATWTTGTRNGKCEWVGWQFLEEITGADAFEIPERPAPWYVSFAAANPITVGVPAGSRVQLESAERVSATASAVDAYWSDYRLFPVDSKLPAEFLGSVLHNQLQRKGRVVWLGFQENAAVAAGPDKRILDAVLLNAAAWAKADVLVGVDPWPAPYSGAVLMALNLKTDADNARYAAETLLRNHVQGAFYCDADHLRNSPALLEELREAGEIGSQGGQDAPVNNQRPWQLWYHLLRLRWQLKKISRYQIAGFSPSYERLPNAAIPGLRASGYRYYLAGGEGNTVLPQVLSVAAKWGRLSRQWPLLRLVRMGDDDLSLSPLGLTGLDQDWIVQRVQADADVIAALGGLYVFGYHSQGLSAPEYSNVLARLVQNWQAKRAWIATGTDLTNWWLRRQQLSVAASTADKGAVRLTVNYTGRDPIHGVVLSIYCPAETPTFTVATAIPSGAQPELMVDAGRQRVQLRLPRLAAGTYSYELR